MSQSPWIKVNERIHSLDELKEPLLGSELSDFEKSTLKFCHDWLNGQQEFHIHTSGSTGAPKSIALLRTQMEASAKQTIDSLNLKAGETALVCLDTKYIGGQMMLVRSLIAGMNIIAIEPSSNPFENLMDQSIDFVALVPYQIENIIDHVPEQLNRVHCAIIGGAAISHSLNEKIKKCNGHIYATYGMTETISHIALQRLNGDNVQDYFEALPSVQLRLDNRGCLRIKTNYLQGEITTNDLVELAGVRKFRWLGRVDNIINSGGIKIIPEKIEKVFEKIFDSFKIKNRFFVTGLPDKKLGSKVTIVIEGVAFDEEFQKQVLLEVKQILTKYELPKEFIFVTHFTETVTGKINRMATIASIH
jgi:O-succinylbenzoic acid--CoA ligase